MICLWNRLFWLTPIQHRKTLLDNVQLNLFKASAEFKQLDLRCIENSGEWFPTDLSGLDISEQVCTNNLFAKIQKYFPDACVPYTFLGLYVNLKKNKI